MSKFYRVRSEAYFRLSEIFVNRRDCGGERSPYPADWKRWPPGGIVATRTDSQFPAPAVVEKLRMRVDIVDGRRKAA
jgi:hypothetical protein